MTDSITILHQSWPGPCCLLSIPAPAAHPLHLRCFCSCQEAGDKAAHPSYGCPAQPCSALLSPPQQPAARVPAQRGNGKLLGSDRHEHDSFPLFIPPLPIQQPSHFFSLSICIQTGEYFACSILSFLQFPEGFTQGFRAHTISRTKKAGPDLNADHRDFSTLDLKETLHRSMEISPVSAAATAKWAPACHQLSSAHRDTAGCTSALQ